jgi:SAM-dependent methyltransferase
VTRLSRQSSRARKPVRASGEPPLFLHELIDVAPQGARVLDAGCGPGSWDYAGRADLRITAFDIKFPPGPPARREGVDVLRAGLERLPLRDGSFDLVVCHYVLEHVTGLTACCDELARLTPEDGHWRNVLAGDVFIFHEGAVSFSGERVALTLHAGKTLADMYPDYVRQVREFVTCDPASALRAAVDRARVELGTEELKQVLAERMDEQTLLRARLMEAEKHAEKLHQVLASTEILLAERDEEIAKLRSGLGHAEALAFQRAGELEALQRSWIWKCRIYLMRMKSRRHPQSPA